MEHDTDQQEAVVKLANLKLFKGIWPFIKPYKWMLVICCILVLTATAFELLIPWMTRTVIDGFIVPVTADSTISLFGLSFDHFHTFGILFFIVLCTAFVIDFGQAVFMEYIGQKIILNLRGTLFSHMSRLAVPFFDQNSSGRLVSRVAGDVENMSEMFTTFLIFIFKDLFLMTGIVFALFIMNARLALYTVLLIPIITIGVILSSLFIRRSFRTIRQKIAEINHMFSETLTGIHVIQTIACEPFFRKKFKQLNHEHFLANMNQIRIFAVFMPFISFMGVIGSAVIIYAGSRRVAAQTLTIGELVAFLFYIRLFFRPLRELSEKFTLLQNALASGERIFTIFNISPALQRRAKGHNNLDCIQSVEFQDVCFSYQKNQPVLRDISFFLPQGHSIGIVGRTGTGKSSLINLLTGFYTPDSGRILINGKDQGTFAMSDIRQRMGLVMQDPVLFSGTIKDNILPPGSCLTDAMLEDTLKLANCNFLFDRYQGLYTKIHQDGRPLSSGEKQLVCIARAFAANADLIIFDEATSYMDSRSEIKIHDAINRLMARKTSIIIAHRLSTVQACDTIYLVRNGQIKESGNHDKLVAMKGEYFQLLEKEKISAASAPQA